jgi:hypothetical protein
MYCDGRGNPADPEAREEKAPMEIVTESRIKSATRSLRESTVVELQNGECWVQTAFHGPNCLASTTRAHLAGRGAALARSAGQSAAFAGGAVICVGQRFCGRAHDRVAVVDSRGFVTI